jgi:Ca-activated chloride channel family protein
LFVAATAALSQEPVFRVDVRLVRLLVTVKDSAGRLVGNLNKEDFSVSDNGVPQELALFERQTEQPLSVALLLDASGSTAKELPYELESVKRFLKALFAEGNPQDSAAFYTFNYEIVLRTSFTRRLARLEEALKGIKAEAGTSLYDAIYLSARDLERRDGRRVIVVVTDGGDTTSTKDFHAALEAAQAADAVMYSLLVMPIQNEAGRNIGGENALATFAAGTGGTVFYPNVGKELDQALADILRDLRTQYLIGFYPKDVPSTKNRFHHLDVKLRDPGLRPQARNGYYGDTEGSAGPRGTTRGPKSIP